MDKKLNLTRWDIICGIILVNAMEIMLDAPYTILPPAGNAFWIVIILMFLISLAVYFTIIYLYNKNDCVGLSIFDVSQKVGGTFLKKTMAIILFFILFQLLITRTQLYSGILNVSAYSLTPIPLLQLLIVFIIIFSMMAGMEVMFKIIGYFIPLFLLCVVVIIILSLGFFDIKNFTPIFGNGISTIASSSVYYTPIFASLLVLIFFGFDNYKYKDMKATLITAHSIGCLVLILVTSSIVSVIAADKISTYQFPIYQTLRSIPLGTYFTGFETTLTYLLYFLTIPYMGLVANMSWKCLCVIFPKINKNILGALMIIGAYIASVATTKPETVSNPEGIIMLFIGFGCFIAPLLIAIALHIKNIVIKRNGLRRNQTT